MKSEVVVGVDFIVVVVDDADADPVSRHIELARRPLVFSTYQS